MTKKVLQVYRIFKQTYSDENAKTIVSFIMDRKQEEINQMRRIFLTKDDKAGLMERISEVKADLIGRMSEVRTDLTGRISTFEYTITQQMADFRADMLNRFLDSQNRLDKHFKWLIGIMIALAGLALTISKLL